MKDLQLLYLEHQNSVLNNLKNIKHIDFWSEQVSFLMEEHPFKAPAVFFAYRSLQMRDLGDKTQKVKMGVDIYYYYETLADTHFGSKNQSKALSFFSELTNIHKLFHGTSGENFSDMKRIGFAPIETGTANLLYLQKFECTVIDDSAQTLLETTKVNNIKVTNEPIIRVKDNDNLYTQIDTY